MARVNQPSPLRPAWLACVFVGGMVGTGLRAGLAAALPHPVDAWPWATFAANITGAFLLAVLIGTLSHRASNPERQRLVRLGLGTGMIGSYTTYSAFAVEVARAPLWLGVGYATLSVLTGIAAAALGLVLVERRA